MALSKLSLLGRWASALFKHAEREDLVPRQLAHKGEVKMANENANANVNVDAESKKIELTLKITNADGSVFYQNQQTWEEVGSKGMITIQRALVGAETAMLDVAESVAKGQPTA